ncbi:MAG: hypothetical protein ACOYMM_10815 [Phycisphaerales bacterium]
MLSHCCSSCGKPLDAASRTYARALRMWVARCPRCGFAVRWSPRGAREPFRTWARLRALNMRLGIALGSSQAAGLLAIGIGALLVQRQRELASFEDLDRLARWGLVLEFLALAVPCAVAGAIGAIAFAPHARRITGIACAWILGALPVTVAGGLFAILSEPVSSTRDIADALQPHILGRIALCCAAVVLVSALLALVAFPIHAWIARMFAARHRRNHVFLRQGHARMPQRHAAPSAAIPSP